MDEKIEAISFMLILHSGNARSEAMKAIAAAKNGDIEKAQKMIEIAKQELANAQKVHASIIQEEARGGDINLSLLLMHSEDHFVMGQLTIDLAKELLDVYRKFERNEDNDK
jgi:PTS system cellobiose-specific IIA component